MRALAGAGQTCRPPACTSCMHDRVIQRQNKWRNPPCPTRQRQHRSVRASAWESGEEADPFLNLARSKVFQVEHVVQEFDSVVNELRQLSTLASRFPEFDLAGKKVFLEKVRDGSNRYQIFLKRLELSGDPAAREYLRYTNAQMLNGGFTLDAMFRGLEQSLGMFEQWVAQEEAVSADPAAHQAFLEGMRQAWGQSAMGRINFADLAKVASPEALVRAQRHPQFYSAVREISESPTPAVMAKWVDHPDIGPLVAAMWKSMARPSADTPQQQQPPAAG